MKHALRNLIRLVAVALFLIGALLAGLEFMRSGLREQPISIASCVIAGGLMIAGVVLFVLSSRLANFFSDDDDGDSTITLPPAEP